MRIKTPSRVRLYQLLTSQYAYMRWLGRRVALRTLFIKKIKYMADQNGNIRYELLMEKKLIYFSYYLPYSVKIFDMTTNFTFMAQDS